MSETTSHQHRQQRCPVCYAIISGATNVDGERVPPMLHDELLDAFTEASYAFLEFSNCDVPFIRLRQELLRRMSQVPNAPPTVPVSTR